MMKTVFSLITFFLLAACKSTPPASDQKPVVLVSLAPYQTIVERIAGDICSVKTIVPLGANPHTYEPHAKQTADIASARLWFCIGEPFEKKMQLALQEKNGHLSTFDLRTNIPLLHSHCCHCSEDDLDRHLWLSPKILLVQIPLITENLIAQFPEHQQEILRNSQALVSQIETLDAALISELSSLSSRSFVVAHPAFAYFCDAYHFHQISVEYEGKDPKPQHLREILAHAQEDKAIVAFAFPQHPSRGLHRVAEELSLPIHTLDPYSSDPLTTIRLLSDILLTTQEPL